MATFTASAKYHKDIGILYVTLSDAEAARSGDLGLWRDVDRAADGTVVGLALVNGSASVNLPDVPHREMVEQFARDAGLPVVDSQPARLRA